MKAAKSLLSLLALLFTAGAMSGCTSGNVRTLAEYGSPAAPPVRQAQYDPYAAYASAGATWVPAAADRHGTIVKPADPANQWDRPDYEGAKWMVGAGSSTAGTF